LRAYLNGKNEEIPVLPMVQSSGAEPKNPAESFARGRGGNAEAVELKSVVGGGSAPETYLPSWGVALDFPGISDAELERRLRNSEPPVIVRLEEGRVILDFRTIFATDEDELLGIIRGQTPNF